MKTCAIPLNPIIGQPLCYECGKILTHGRRKYCSRKCSNAYLQRWHRAKKMMRKWAPEPVDQ